MSGGDNLKIVFLSSEVNPFAKTGGLADVAASLPVALEKLGQQVIVIMPKYRGMKGRSARLGKNVNVYFIENDKYYDREGLYGDKAGDYKDNIERFTFYCNGALALLKEIGFSPDIIHCNDWQTALVPIYLKTKLGGDPFFKGTKTVFTIHNLAYQGLFPKEEFSKTGLDESLFSMKGLEFYGKISLMKGGIIYSDKLTTVSSAYSREIQTEEYGCGLEGVLRERKKDLTGILNGLDYDLWDPSRDEKIVRAFDPENIEGKDENKRALRSEMGLEDNPKAPLIGIISRLADQKGFDILAEAIDEICGMDLQIILLGAGDIHYHTLFEKIKGRHPANTSINLKFDALLAQKIYASSDMFLMPSRYEPCGLGQLISFKYGTIPIVRKTGGLADTVIDYNEDEERGNGFVFEEYSSGKLLDAIKRALGLYHDKALWLVLAKRVMALDFSWERSAAAYLNLYRKAVSK